MHSYDFLQSRQTPYANQLKRQITTRLDTTSVTYLNELVAELGMPNQNLINLFLRDCAMQNRRPVIQWPQESGARTKPILATALPSGLAVRPSSAIASAAACALSERNF